MFIFGVWMPRWSILLGRKTLSCFIMSLYVVGYRKGIFFNSILNVVEEYLSIIDVIMLEEENHQKVGWLCGFWSVLINFFI